MNMQAILAKRRDGLVHAEEELVFLANGAADGSIPDYQLSAWLMAAVLHPLSPSETAWLTMAMARSGRVLDLSSLPKPWVDKHSTGGVGDKTSLVVTPLLAACGVTIVKMSGRGLGITGGTVDKLESIPGFRMDLNPDEMIEQAKRIGCAITGPTADLAPADRALYALRDSTSTVASIPLIVSSILSKKVAGGAKTVVMDVKCGSGAFMKDLDEAERLTEALQETATLCGIDLRAVISDMNQPLGRAVGNALEVREALEVLHGDLVGRFATLCLHVAGTALFATARATSQEDGVAAAREAVRRGLALDKAIQWFEAQGADPAIARTISGLPEAGAIFEMDYDGADGWVAKVDARTVGEVAMELGAGRKTKADPIDPGVGVEVLVQVGSRIQAGIKTFRIHAKNLADAKRAKEWLNEALTVSSVRIPEAPLILATR